MKTRLKEIKQDISHLWWGMPNSSKLGHGLLLLTMILSGIFLPELLIIIWIMGSILAIATVFDGFEGSDPYNSLWIFFMPIMWLLIGLVILDGVGRWVWYRTFDRLIDWIDKKD
jgi:hypothetical protein